MRADVDEPVMMHSRGAIIGTTIMHAYRAVSSRFLSLFRLSDGFDKCHVTRYNDLMIKSFADRETQQLFTTGKSKRLPPDLVRRALRRLEYVDLASDLNDLTVPPSNRLHALHGDRAGQHSIAINDPWRVCFLFVNGDAYDVEITDYH